MFKNPLKISVLCVCNFFLIVNFGLIANLSWAQEAIDFNQQVRPILSNQCFHCHGPDENTREADLRLDSQEGILENEDLINLDKPMESELLQRVFSEDQDERMPPHDSNLKLSRAEKETLLKWIQQGAKWEKHWAFEAPQRSQLPAVRNKNWPKTPIDYFVLAKLESENIVASAEEKKQRLLRRVTFDLTGLPPTIEQMEAFLKDDSGDAFERVVDQLMASPGYGERMAWDWLDAARYADTNGFQGDPTREMWPWRDWVVDALNSNMSFDQFTTEQLAGDLLPNATLDQKIATAFNRNHMHNGEGGRIAEETRVENVLDRVETTGTVWLGLTMNCCRCHDHKYDRLSQKEYYQFYAFFNSTSERGGISGGRIPPFIDAPNERQSDQLNQLQKKIEESAKRVKELEVAMTSADNDEVKKQKGDAKGAIPDSVKKLLSKPPSRRNSDELSQLAKQFESNTSYVQASNELKKQVNNRINLKKSFPKVMVMDSLSKPRESFVLSRGLYNKKEAKVSPGTPAVLPQMDSATKTKNRLTLANWLMAPNNPLTARVIVNRQWQRFFGTGLVKTAEDFGVQGELPSHPKLLDWLAVEFQDSGWDVKHLQKLIVTSAAYQQSARSSRALSSLDPENRLISRGPRRRLPSWMIRDHALASSGLLVQEFSGLSVRPYQPKNIWAEATFGKIKYQQDHGRKLYRRSLYTFWRRIVGPAMFFDSSKRQTCEVRKTSTNTPLHALVTLNDVTFVESARVMAMKLLLDQELKSDRDRIQRAFRLATSRIPLDVEIEVLTSRLQTLKDSYEKDPEAAKQFLEIGEYPNSKQLNPAELASLAGICTLVLNLDESLTR